jgi:hypothetical protein
MAEVCDVGTKSVTKGLLTLDVGTEVSISAS